MKPSIAIRVFVVDDEGPARRKITRLLSQDASVVIVGEASSGSAAVAGIAQSQPDLLFLDIQMPDMNGFEVIAALEGRKLPKVVFATAHDEYAIRALELHAFGYLLKPFDSQRFISVLQDAKKHLEAETTDQERTRLRELLFGLQQQKQLTPRLLVQENGRCVLVELNRIDWAESSGNYLELHIGKMTHRVRGTIESLEQKLDSSSFLRINRSCLIRMTFIREIHLWSHGEYRVVLPSGEIHTWTRRYVDRHPDLLRKL
jgi:two-component system LytT family response regulator